MLARQVVEDRQVNLAEARGVGDHVDLDDLPTREREVEYPKQPSTRSHDDSYSTVHERRSCEMGKPRVGEGLLGARPRSADFPRSLRRRGGAVGTDHDVRVEHSDERVEVTTAQCSEEGVDNFSLAGGPICIWICGVI